MAEHKHATEVAIASTTDRSEFTSWVFRWWKAGALVLLVGSVALLATQYQADAAKAEEVASWEALGEAVEINNPGLFLQSDPDEIAAVARDQAANPSGPWARYLEASVRDQAGDGAGAGVALEQLAADHPDHLLNTLRVKFSNQATPLTVVERLSMSLQDQASWEVSHPALFDNPHPSADAPSVRIVTTEGPILVALYPDLAPKHVENFLKLCGEGFYNDTKFHRVIPNFMIQGGDPNSKDPDVALWGQGGPGYKVDREENELRHFVGYLAAAKNSGETESSGSQFYITTGAPHHLDGQHVIFGKVIEGMETVGIIESAVVVFGTATRPETPATITSTEVL